MNTVITKRLLLYLPSSFSSLIIALLNFASSMPRLLRLVSWLCFSLLKDFKSKIFSSSIAFTLLFKSFKVAKPLATTAKRTTTATHKTNKRTFMTKFERCLLVLDSFSFLSIALAVKCRKMFLAIFRQPFARRSQQCKMTRLRTLITHKLNKITHHGLT